MTAEALTTTVYTIVVPTRGRATDFMRISENFTDVPTYIPLLVVANTGFADTEILTERPNTRVLFVPGGGVARVRNAGLLVAETNIVLFLDDDILPCLDALKILVDNLSTSHISVATSRICPSSLEEPISTLYGLFFSVDRGTTTRTFSRNDSEKISPMSAWSLGVGGAFGVNLRCLKTSARLPLFDETLSNGRFCGGAEDVDFFLQCYQAGLTIKYCGDAMLIHQEAPNLKKLRTRMLQYARADGAFYAKWRNLLGVRDIVADVAGWAQRVKLHVTRHSKGQTGLPLIALLREPVEKVVGALWWRWIAS